MLLAHKIRLNPTPEQEQWLLKACGIARFVFNWALAEWKRQYESDEKPSAYDLKKQFNAIKRQEFPWIYAVTKCAQDSGFRNLDAAFKNFFRRCRNGDKKKGYPRFKSKRRSRKSFRMDGERIKIDDHWLKLQTLSTQVNRTEALRFDGKIKSVSLSEHAGHWYVSVLVEVEPPPHVHPQESVGIDLGLKTLAVLSDGTQFENQKLLRSELNKLKRLNRELSRRQSGSGRWKRTKMKLARFHARIARRRLDYLHKMTTQIAKTYRVIGIEDLNVSGMIRNRRLALSLADAGFGEIRRQLSYKSEWHSGVLIAIDRFFPSSKLCHFCDCINDNLTLADREWTCACGAVHDRDWNAAINVEVEALRTLAGVSSTDKQNARGANVRPLPGQFAMKRENMGDKGHPSRLVQGLVN